jgi:catechol 2,3-dioxygenase-like lactoylglutathione lyase family enzyme
VCATVVLAGCVSRASSLPAPSPASAASTAQSAPAARLASVRYQVADVDRAVAFYTRHLGFRLEEKTGAAFAAVTLDSLRLILSGPGSSGSRPMPDGRRQAPGGWNRIVLYVDDLDARIAALTKAAVRFRNTLEVGPGGTQILLDDPDGNPIELHQAPAGLGR